MSFSLSPYPGYIITPTGTFYQRRMQPMTSTIPQSPQIYQPHAQQFFPRPNHFINSPPRPLNTLAPVPHYAHPTQMGLPEIPTHFPTSSLSPLYTDAPLPTNLYGSEYSDLHPHSFVNHAEDVHFVGNTYNPPLHPYDTTRSYTPPDLPIPSIRHMSPAPPVSPAPSAWFPGTPPIAPLQYNDLGDIAWDTTLPNGLRINMPAFAMVWRDDLNDFLYYWWTPCGYMLLPIYSMGQYPRSTALLPMVHWLAAHSPPFRFAPAVVFPNV